MQTILGSGGAIGIGLAKALVEYTKDIRLVSRNPQKVNPTDSLFAADLLNKEDVFKAVQGSEVCYVTLGLEYKLSVWQRDWVPFIKHVLESCEQNHCRLVFFDNVYALNKTSIHKITEESPIKPSSKKGEVRAEINHCILKAIKEGRVEAIIARAPDFLGAEKKQNSLVMNLIYNNFKKDKSAQWFGSADIPHSMGYTPDLAKGTAILGNTLDAYNQIWNLPVSQQPITGRDWATLFASEMKVENKISSLPFWILKVLGIFVPFLGELHEMMYQYESEYFFDSSKFIKRFNYQPKSNEEAVKEIVSALNV